MTLNYYSFTKEIIMYKSKQIEKYQVYRLGQWIEDGRTYKGEVTYGMHYILGNSQPYFSITGNTWRQAKNGKWVEDSCGCLHDLIVKKRKSLAPLISFHLSDQNGLPMYYLENGYYWYKENLETFKSYIRLSEDEEIPLVPEIELPVILSDSGKELDLPEKEKEKIREKFRKQFICQWLKTREDKLRKEFDEVMEVFGVEYISQEEIEALKAK
jgi:hypothetical protein